MTAIINFDIYKRFLRATETETTKTNLLAYIDNGRRGL